MNGAILKAAQAVIETATPGEEREWPEFERLRTAIRDWQIDQPEEAIRERIVTAAQELNVIEDGVCEVDDGAAVSIGDENGCYVAAWVWLSFRDIRGLDRNCPSCGHTHANPITADWKCYECGYAQKNWEEQTFCRDCDEPYDSAGDGYDGRCPACADKAEEAKAPKLGACTPTPKRIREFLEVLHSNVERGDKELTPLFARELANIVKNMEAK